MHVIAIGDIGPVDEMIHIGDEAMFEEAIRRLRQRGVTRVTAISSHPADTAARYGLDAVAPVAHGGSAEELEALVAGADGVLVTGGGNISSVWPAHIRERAELARFAANHGRPFVVTGQTLGPALSEPDRAIVARMLGTARLVGTREAASASLAASLGVPADRAQQNVDDASFLASDRDDERSSDSAPYALVTVARHVGQVDAEVALSAYAALLDDVAAHTGLEVRFHAHFASLTPHDSRGDSAVHSAIAERMRADVTVAPTTDALTSARLAAGAALVVTSRYHPAVFAAVRGVPTIGLPVDDYTTVKLDGALRALGQNGLLPLPRLLAEGGDATVRRVWGDRARTRDRGIRLADSERPRVSAWWDRVRRSLEP